MTETSIWIEAKLHENYRVQLIGKQQISPFNKLNIEKH